METCGNFKAQLRRKGAALPVSVCLDNLLVIEWRHRHPGNTTE